MRDMTQSTTPSTAFQRGQFVLYRDPELFWTGQAGHTFVCRVNGSSRAGTWDLMPLPHGKPICHANPDYMRLLPAIDAMRDIDTAPLHADGAADDMSAAAFAWLTQQHTVANQPPQLPDLGD